MPLLRLPRSPAPSTPPSPAPSTSLFLFLPLLLDIVIPSHPTTQSVQGRGGRIEREAANLLNSYPSFVVSNPNSVSVVAIRAITLVQSFRYPSRSRARLREDARGRKQRKGVFALTLPSVSSTNPHQAAPRLVLPCISSSLLRHLLLRLELLRVPEEVGRDPIKVIQVIAVPKDVDTRSSVGRDEIIDVQSGD